MTSFASHQIGKLQRCGSSIALGVVVLPRLANNNNSSNSKIYQNASSMPAIL
ncbi:MAG TPA: hypothetical protein VE619_11185 [Nitrososphaeraceae archaeon]|nr:hypothetical protein [Nitrososphaeraceae archaeon]